MGLCEQHAEYHLWSGPLVQKSIWAPNYRKDPGMVIKHQRYKGVLNDVSNTSRLHHERIAFVLFFYSEFNKFTDRMLEILE